MHELSIYIFLDKTEIIDSYAEEYVLWKKVIFLFFIEVIMHSDVIANFYKIQ